MYCAEGGWSAENEGAGDGRDAAAAEEGARRAGRPGAPAHLLRAAAAEVDDDARVWRLRGVEELGGDALRAAGAAGSEPEERSACRRHERRGAVQQRGLFSRVDGSPGPTSQTESVGGSSAALRKTRREGRRQAGGSASQGECPGAAGACARAQSAVQTCLVKLGLNHAHPHDRVVGRRHGDDFVARGTVLRCVGSGGGKAWSDGQREAGLTTARWAPARAVRPAQGWQKHAAAATGSPG